MHKSTIIHQLIPNLNQTNPREKSSAFAPANIALCKYWGKRNSELNLPFNSSLSIALANKGAVTEISINNNKKDKVVLNEQEISAEESFAKKISAYLDLIFSPQRKFFFDINTKINIPIAAGLASSACGFAALIKALNELFVWQLSDQNLSILARLGSGSACRSLWNGFVEWQAGSRADGLDSYAYPLQTQWPELRIGLLLLSEKVKPISSRDAMKIAVQTSPFYQNWVTQATQDLQQIKNSIAAHDFLALGKLAERNALTMHATMHTSWPPINYNLPATNAAMQTIWQMREEKIPVFFTQDAGPNLKLLFLQQDLKKIQDYFPDLEIITPFSNPIL